jgi:hypothetical protein
MMFGSLFLLRSLMLGSAAGAMLKVKSFSGSPEHDLPQ